LIPVILFGCRFPDEIRWRVHNHSPSFNPALRIFISGGFYALPKKFGFPQPRGSRTHLKKVFSPHSRPNSRNF